MGKVVFIALSATAGLVLATLVCPRSLPAAKGDEADRGVPYSWASKRIDGEVWGFKQADVDGDGVVEALLLERERLVVGTFDGTGFKKSFSCTWKGSAKAARLDITDLDGDGREEALITAVDDGISSSLALRIGKEGCEQILSGVPLSLRAMWLPPRGDSTEWTWSVVGQGWSSQRFFSGPIEEYRFEGGKLKSAGRIKLPRNTMLYRFAFLPPEDGASTVVLYRSAAPLEVRVNTGGNRWKRMWRSGEKYGSSGNIIEAVQRPALDQVQSYYASFELPPVVLRDAAGADILMVKYDMPLHDIVGRTPYISASRVFGYRPDPAFVYAQGLMTQEMPGDVVDYTVDEAQAGRTLYVLIQDNRGAFENPTESMVLRFDLGSVNMSKTDGKPQENEDVEKDTE